MDKSIYLPGLNGIRAIAAIGVMLSHINLALEKFGVKNYSLFGFNGNNKLKGWTLGEQGVTMFFVLSGFLITYLLLKERQKADKINIKNFYYRRILRIWPLYYLFLFLAVLTVYLTKDIIPGIGTISFYIFLLANIPFIIERALPACDHLWSIAVEEQFYLFWPHLFRKNNIDRFFKVLIGVFIICAVLRVLLWKFLPFKMITVLFTVNRFDCMVFGGIIAIILLYKPQISNVIQMKFIQIISWFVIIIHFFNHEIINSIISLELVTVSVGFIIIGQVASGKKIVNLENRFLNFLGKYSYGIYIYHPLVIFIIPFILLFLKIRNEFYLVILAFLLVIVITLIVAYLSYQFFEKSFIQKKNKFSIVHSTNENNLTK